MNRTFLTIFLLSTALIFQQCSEEEEQLPQQETVTDVEGNTYPTVTIGKQTWMAENLRATTYADGTPIDEITSNTEWSNLDGDDKAYSWLNNDVANSEPYGAYYTWAAATNNMGSETNPSNVQGVCPDGWHLPSSEEYGELLDYVRTDQALDSEGAVSIFVIYIDELGLYLRSDTGWPSGNNGTDEYGFNGAPNGSRNNQTGEFENEERTGQWWATDDDSDGFDVGAYFGLVTGVINEGDDPFIDEEEFNDYPLNDMAIFAFTNKTTGMPVRCVQD